MPLNPWMIEMLDTFRTGRKGKVLPQQLRMRAEPDGAVLKILLQNTAVEILRDHGVWLKIRVDGEVGYVKSSFVLFNRHPVPESRD